MFSGIHHVCYAVPDLEEALAFFQRTFGFSPEEAEIGQHKGSGSDYAFFPAADFLVEFQANADPESRIGRAIEERGGAHLDHIAYGVHDMDGVIARLQQQGIRLMPGQPAVAATGWRIASLDRRDTLGIWIQLVDLDHR